MNLNLSNKEKYIIEHLKYIFSYTFQALLFIFLITLLLQQFYPLQVNSRININWFMVIVIIFGALSILFPAKSETLKQEHKPGKKDILLIILLGIAGAVIIFLKLNSLGWIGYVISILGGLIIIFLSWLVLTEKDETQLS